MRLAPLARRLPPLFGLAPGGVYRAASVAGRAVRSYRTLSPLPAVFRGTGAGGLLSVALSLGSPPPDVIRHRTSVEPGLSSPRIKPGSGRPAIWRGGNVGRMAVRVKCRLAGCKGHVPAVLSRREYCALICIVAGCRPYIGNSSDLILSSDAVVTECDGCLDFGGSGGPA